VAGPGDRWRWRRSWRESEEKEERKEEEEESFGRSIMILKGVSEGGTLPSTMAQPSCHMCTPGHHQCWHPPTHLRCQPPWRPNVRFIYGISFPMGLFIKKVFL
jgi:hypothetical protein